MSKPSNSPLKSRASILGAVVDSIVRGLGRLSEKDPVYKELDLVWEDLNTQLLQKPEGREPRSLIDSLQGFVEKALGELDPQIMGDDYALDFAIEDMEHEPVSRSQRVLVQEMSQPDGDNDAAWRIGGFDSEVLDEMDKGLDAALALVDMLGHNKLREACKADLLAAQSLLSKLQSPKVDGLVAAKVNGPRIRAA